MTEITERRLKCDYCGNISPVIEGDAMPKGWITKVVDMISETPKAPNGRPAMRTENWQNVHFCTDAHYRVVFGRVVHDVELIE